MVPEKASQKSKGKSQKSKVPKLGLLGTEFGVAALLTFDL
jgi:hypothetical protein